MAHELCQLCEPSWPGGFELSGMRGQEAEALRNSVLTPIFLSQNGGCLKIGKGLGLSSTELDVGRMSWTLYLARQDVAVSETMRSEAAALAAGVEILGPARNPRYLPRTAAFV